MLVCDVPSVVLVVGLTCYVTIYVVAVLYFSIKS